MKRIFAIILAAAAFLAAENTADAQLLKNLVNKVKGTTTTTTTQPAETVSAATTNGRTAGVALKSLFTQYKADGKLDMGNINNLLNLTTLASNLQGLKGQTNKGAFYKDFAAGLVLGSGNLVTQSTTTSVMSGLSNLVNNVDLSGLAAAAAAAAPAPAKQETTSSAVSALASAASTLTNASEKANTAVENASEIAESVSSILNLFK